MSSYTTSTLATSMTTSSTIPEIIEDNVDFLLEENEDLVNEEELQSGKSQGQRFVIKFINAIDIPAANDFRSKVDPFLRAHICVHQSHLTKENRTMFKLKRISEYVTTPRRSDCNSAIWNSFRDFRITPPTESILTVECLHAISDPNKPHVLLGKVDIPIASLSDDSVKTFYFVPFKGNRQKNPKFSVNLQRVWIDEKPPKIKTFFLIRHGESKWNKAQSKIDIPGLLDRDHPLTELGIHQAESLNQKWKEHMRLGRYHMQMSPGPCTGAVTTSSTPGTPEKSNSKLPCSPKNNATSNLLDLDDYEETQQSIAAASSSSTVKATPGPADTPSSKSAIDFFGDNFINWGFGGEVDVDEDFGTNSIDSSDDEDSEDEDEEDRDESDHRNKGKGKGREREEVDDNVDGNADHLDFDEGEGDVAERQTELNRNTDFLVKEFHQADINIQEKEEAEKRHDGYVKLFLHADRVFTSPLTRAMQTALLSMEGHRAVECFGFTLYSIIREVKRIGGLDTVGIEVGEGIEKRVRAELAAIVGPTRADQLTRCPIDVNDADQVWWTPMSSHDAERDQQERVVEFLTFSRYCDAKIPVFVGHSLFFRAFYSKRVSNRLLINRRQLSENLKRFRLSNASMLAVTVAYKDIGGGLSEAVMLDADLIFGGGFHASGPDKRDFIAQLSTSPAASSVFSNINLGIASSGIIAANIQSELRDKKEQLSNGLKKFSEKLYDIFEK